MPYKDPHCLAAKECVRKSKKKYRDDPLNKIKMADYAKHRAITSKAKVALEKKRWALANPDRVRDSILKREYGITLQDWNDLFIKQNGRCANKKCNKHQSELKRILCVDHKHVEGYNQLPPEQKKKCVRGLLCDTCNKALGLAYDDINILDGLKDYLARATN